MLNEVLSKRIKLVELKLLYDMKKPLTKPIRKMLVDAVRGIRAEVKSSGIDELPIKSAWRKKKLEERRKEREKKAKAPIAIMKVKEGL